MYLLYESEIKALAIQAEQSLDHQNSIMGLLKSNPEYKSLILPTTPVALASRMLQGKHYLEGDLLRLSEEIEKNLKERDWYNNL